MRRSRSLRRTFFFFFQAEDGIRDGTVTGVQTCALPIFPHGRRLPRSIACRRSARPSGGPLGPTTLPVGGWSNAEDAPRESRSEERRVGKGVELGGRRITKKKKESKTVTYHNSRKTARAE